MSKDNFLQLEKDADRIERKMQNLQEFVKHGTNSDNLREEFDSLREEADDKFKEIEEFCENNKQHQFMSRRLMGRVQVNRERAARIERKLHPSPGRTQAIVQDIMCPICFEGGREGFRLECTDRHTFCAQCLANHIQVQTESNRPACCPSCSPERAHELFEKEIQAICDVADIPGVVFDYMDRCQQRRVEDARDTLFCPKRCGNAVCSRISDIQAVCDKCNYVFCPRCGEAAHPKEPTCSKNLQKRMEEASGAELKRMQDELKSIEFLEAQRLEACPHCAFPCEKISGCDHVRCAKCSNNFSFGTQKTASGMIMTAHGVTAAQGSVIPKATFENEKQAFSMQHFSAVREEFGDIPDDLQSLTTRDSMTSSRSSSSSYIQGFRGFLK